MNIANRHKETLIDFKKTSVSPRKLLVFIPGISGGVGTDKHSFLVREAHANGYDYLAVQPWDDGEDVGVYSISSILKVISQNIHKYNDTYDKVNVIGKSIGGTLALLLQDECINSITAWAPVFKMQEGSEKDQEALLERVVDTGLPQTFFNKIAQKKIIYGTADPHIYPEAYQKLKSGIPNINVVSIDGADHSFTDKKEQLLIETFRQKYLIQYTHRS